MANFFTSDTHFGHARIIELCDRPFTSVSEMNETIVQNFNAVAGVDDTIYHLGDACMGKLEESLECIRAIQARVVLVPGNHDRMSRANAKEFRKTEKRERWVREYGQVFSEVWVEPETGPSQFLAPFTVPDSGWPVVMSHYPYRGDSHGEERYRELRPRDEGAPLIHGHVHTAWKFNGRQFNVGVDVNEFSLVSEEEVLKWTATL